MEDLERALKFLGTRQRSINDPFLENSQKFCNIFERVGVIIKDEEELCHEVMKEFPCNACAATFTNLLDYELHYHNSHHFVCAKCKKKRPTARLLEIHVQETHDNFFKVMAEKQPMYQCFVAECSHKFFNPDYRRYHCRTIHAFPKNYRFDEDKIIHFDEYEMVKKNSEDSKENTKSKTKSNITMDVDEQYKPKEKKNSAFSFGKCTNETFKKNYAKKHSGIDSSKVPSNDKRTFTPTTMFIPRQVQQKIFTKKLTENLQLKQNVFESSSLMEIEESLPKI